MLIRGVVVVLSVLLSASPALAWVLDFEDLGVAVGTQLNPPVNATTVSRGFTFSSPGADLHFHNQDGMGNDGTTNLGAHGLVTFSPTGGGTFSLEQFSFDYFHQDLGSISVIGHQQGGGTVTQSFVTDGVPSPGPTSTYQTFVLNGGFVNLLSVDISSGAPNVTTANGFFVDNIVVPEPTTLLLLGSGLVGIVLRAARRPRRVQ